MKVSEDPPGSGARESGAAGFGARESGARESGARESGAQESGARESGAGSGAAGSGAAGSGVRVSWVQAGARRLARHGLDSPLVGLSPAAAASAMCGVHAQVMSAAELSVGTRLVDTTRVDVHVALRNTRTLVKTYGPRGTVHLLPAADLPMWTGALASIPYANQFAEGVRLTPDQQEEIVAAIAAALDGCVLTLDELDEAVVGKVGDWAGDLVMPAFQQMWARWRQAITVAAHRGVLCFGPNRGNKVTFTNPGCVPATDALVELIVRYLRAYGPSTPRWFARWFGAPVAWSTEAFAAAGPRIEPVDFEGEPAWVAAGDAVFPDERPSGLRLLPYFDAYVVGTQPRARLYPGTAATRALIPSGQAGNYPVMLVDGEVAGVWHAKRSGSRVDIAVEPLTDLTPARRRALDDEAARVGHIMEAEPRLRIGEVTAGPHA